ncbi:hypothetical protein H6501_05360 [Candidatus Woesearchaeota archaeon]|nr:hypothetical protein [Nanoarchaeota archaeon]MCB9371002.1 hypothetical protein [Candidatus Woesearchaeota archaeon]USN44114.1 MAG: hypothetical protein H6500_07035 [Candidatus Woesearchaeota archaeon]
MEYTTTNLVGGIENSIAELLAQDERVAPVVGISRGRDLVCDNLVGYTPFGNPNPNYSWRWR